MYVAEVKLYIYSYFIIIARICVPELILIYYSVLQDQPVPLSEEVDPFIKVCRYVKL